MNIINTFKQPRIYLGLAICLGYTSCDGSDDGGSPSAATFQKGFNPQTLQTASQVWLINNANSSNFVAAISSSNTAEYTYTFNGKKATASAVPFTYSSLGTSATLDSNFSSTGISSTYSLLTAELGKSMSPLSIAVAAFDSTDTAAAAIIDAANDVVPNLIIFYSNGTFYTLDRLKMVTNNNNQGTQTLTGSPIIFTSSQASQGSGAQSILTNIIEVTYLRPTSGAPST